MSPNLLRLSKILIAVTPFLSAIVLFQNCSSQTQWSASSSSEPDIVDLNHEDRDHGNEGHAEKVTTYNPLLSDRAYVDLVLNEIFNGTSSAELPAIEAFVALKNDSFGKPCSIYSDYKTSASTRHVALSFCPFSESTLNAALNPPTLVTREAYLAFTCERMVEINSSFDTALKKISGTTTVVIPPASSANLLKLFQLFYRAKPNPQPGLIQAFQVLFNDPAKPTRDEWKAAVFTMCVSGYWQVQ